MPGAWYILRQMALLEVGYSVNLACAASNSVATKTLGTRERKKLGSGLTAQKSGSDKEIQSEGPHRGKPIVQRTIEAGKPPREELGHIAEFCRASVLVSELGDECILFTGLLRIAEHCEIIPQPESVEGGFSTNQGFLRSKDMNVDVRCVNPPPTIGGIQQVLVSGAPNPSKAVIYSVRTFAQSGGSIPVNP